MTHSCVWHDAFSCVIWFSSTCDMTHSYVWHDYFWCLTWLIPTCDMTHCYIWHASLLRVTWLIATCDMTLFYVWHDSFLHETWLNPTCDMTHAYTWHDFWCWYRQAQVKTRGNGGSKKKKSRRVDPNKSEAEVNLLNEMWPPGRVWMRCTTNGWMSHVTHEWVREKNLGVSTQTKVRQKSNSSMGCGLKVVYGWVMLCVYEWCVTRVNELGCVCMSRVTLVNAIMSHMNEACLTCGWVMSRIRMSHVTHIDKWCYTYEWVMLHTWISHVTHMIKLVHLCMSHVTHEWVMSHMN